VIDERPDPRKALDGAFGDLYEELHRIAARQFAGERADHTLQPTAIVGEAYLKLVRQAELPPTRRSDLLGLAAHAMRQVLVDHARRRGAQRRGGARRRTTLGEHGIEIAFDDVLAVDEALLRLQRIDPRLHRVVEYRFFGGLTVEETAEALGVTPRTVQRDWVKARAWLHATLSVDGTGRTGDE
jgi:RNA polymerase sigma factor (TIGR02999 family)